MNKNKINSIDNDESVTHYELEHPKGKIDVFLESGDNEHIFVIKDYDGKTFITFDFDSYCKVIDEYYKR